jgi:hypothetical protein
MPSRLTSRSVKLAWTDFAAPPPAGKARELDGAMPGKSVFLAATFSNISARYGAALQPGFDAVPGSSPAEFVLRDDVTLNAEFNSQRSWRVINHLSDKGKDFLLDHEQGHYNITFLMARDCFIEIMQVKARSFPSAADGAAAVTAIFNRYHDAWDKVQSKYDWDTNHGEWNQPSFGPAAKSSDQLRWEGFMQRALTEERSPSVQAPDGATYKARLLDIVRAGIVARGETPGF